VTEIARTTESKREGGGKRDSVKKVKKEGSNESPRKLIAIGDELTLPAGISSKLRKEKGRERGKKLSAPRNQSNRISALSLS